jgi:hypothetical protein
VAQNLASRTTSPSFVFAAAEQGFRLASAQGHASRDISIIAELWRTAAGRDEPS